MRKYLLCFLFLNVACVISNASDKVHWPERAFEYYQGGRIDTVFHVKYTMLFYKGNCNDGETTVGLDIIEGGDTLISLMNCELTLYDFCSDSMITDDNGCIFRDINHDGIPEMIIDLYWGGMHCCHEFGIYSLSRPAKILALDSGSGASVTIKDIDKDSIPELIYCDENWAWWGRQKVWGEGPCPPLIFKWDGTILRVANFKFPEFLFSYNTLPLDQIKSELLEEKNQNRFKISPSDSPYSDLFCILGLYAYAGKLDQVDSILNYCWPDSTTGKAEADSIFLNWLTTDQYWPDIQKSNW